MSSPTAWLTNHSSTLLFLLLDATAKGSLLLLAGLAATSVMRARAAAVRHFVWALAMTALLVLPILSMLVPRGAGACFPRPLRCLRCKSRSAHSNRSIRTFRSSLLRTQPRSRKVVRLRARLLHHLRPR